MYNFDVKYRDMQDAYMKHLKDIIVNNIDRYTYLRIKYMYEYNKKIDISVKPINDDIREIKKYYENCTKIYKEIRTGLGLENYNTDNAKKLRNIFSNEDKTTETDAIKKM